MSFQRPAVGQRTFTRPMLVLAAWVCLVTQLSALTHFLIVEHVRCAQHGELIHAHDEHPTAVVNARATVPSPSKLVTLPEGSEEHDHDHCLVSAEQKEVSPGGCFVSKPKVPPVQPSLSRDVPRTVAIAERIYAFAPKTSPPA